VLLPTLTLAILCAFFATVYHWAPALVFLLVIICVGAGIMQWRQSLREQNPLRFYVALECLAAVAAGVAVGWLVYDRFLAFYWYSVESHVYTNILPTEPATGYIDAGKLVFADDSVVNKNHSVGFKDHRVFCVAPIIEDPAAVLALGEPQAVHFWAVGLDCCGARGAFSCDDSWDWRARSGFVVRSHEMHAQYVEAAQQAEAAFGLPAPMGEQLFVRWVRDPERLELNYWRSGAGLLFAAVVLQALVSCVAAGFVLKSATGRASWGFR